MIKQPDVMYAVVTSDHAGDELYGPFYSVPDASRFWAACLEEDHDDGVDWVTYRIVRLKDVYA